MARLGASTKHDQLRARLATVDIKQRQTDRQFETPRSGTARVEVEHFIVAPLDRRLVRVTADHNADATGRGVEVQSFQIMQNVDPNAVMVQLQILG